MAKRKCPRGRQLPKIRGADDVVRLLGSLLCEDCRIGEVVVAIDWDMRPLGLGVRGAECTLPPLDSAQLVLLAEEFAACEVVVVTFVEEDELAPTPADVARFEGWSIECEDDDVALLDHILVSGHRWRSVAELSAGRDA